MMAGLLAPQQDFAAGGLLGGGAPSSADAGGPLSLLGDILDWWRAKPSVLDQMRAVSAMRSHTGDPLADFRADAHNPALRQAATDVASQFNMAGIFGGVGAKTANLAKLSAAETMEQAGAHPETIRQETGWFRGPDKQWRFEISDRGSSLTGKNPASMAEPTVGATFSHPDLYAAYPDLADIRVGVGQRPGAGSYDPTGYLYQPRISVSEYDVTTRPDTGRSVMLHELQHAVQEHEGMARGGSPETMRLDQLNALARRSDELNRKWMSGNITDSEFAELQSLGAQRERLLSDPKAGRDSYQRLAGEVEARNVQKRADYTSRDRQDISPLATQDIPYAQQILSTKSGPAAGDVIDLGGVLERRMMDEIRKRNLADLTRSGYFPTKNLPNGYSVAQGIGLGPEHDGVGFALVTPQGAPVLYGRSAEDLIRRGFQDDEAKRLLFAIGGPRDPNPTPPLVVQGPWGR